MRIYGIKSRTTDYWMSGEKNPSWNGGPDKLICKQCGKEFERAKANNKYKNTFCSKECSTEWFIGENASNWRGGKSFEPYAPEFNKRLRIQIRKRDNYACQECGKTRKEIGRSPSVHHIDYNKKNNNPDNLICLCDSCHGKTTYNRKDWTAYFKEKLLNKERLNKIR